MSIIKDKYLIWFLLLSFFLLSLIDIGNPDALRQGTEGFYLLISDEMFRDGYFLTPRLVGGNHWSKPPFHFWLPMPFQFILGGSYLANARISILVFSLMGLVYFSRLITGKNKNELVESLFFFTATFCFLKYSRIYMMEMPLSILIFACSLSFFKFIESRNSKYLAMSIISASLGVLVKGPVSLAISFGSILGFILFEKIIQKIKYDKVVYRNFIIWLLLSVGISSLWFFYCYLKYGNEFYEYFFIRENIGKFNAKNYPISSLIKGLLIFSFPVIIFLPRAIKHFIKHQTRLGWFLISSFIVSYFIWFIPNQKSHHYAVPGIFPLIYFIYLNIKNCPNLKIEKLTINTVMFFFLILLIMAGIFGINVEIPFFANPSTSKVTFALAFITLNYFFLLYFKHSKLYFFFLSTFFSLIWVLFLPVFLLPTVPAKVVDLTKNTAVSVVFRKPYFIQEGLNKEIEIYGHDTIRDKINRSDEYYIVPQDVYDSQGLASVTEIIHKWPLWKRGLEISAILDSFSSKNSQNLVEYLLLLKKR